MHGVDRNAVHVPHESSVMCESETQCLIVCTSNTATHDLLICVGVVMIQPPLSLDITFH